MKNAACEKCKYIGNVYVDPRGDVRTAGLFVAVEYPQKRDAQKGYIMAGNDGDILFNTLKRYIDRNSCYIMPVVRCKPPERKFPDTPIAQKCWKIYGETDFNNYSGELILCVGYWAVRMLTGRELKEVHGKVISSAGKRYACIEHPQAYVKKYVKWEQVDGRWRPAAGTMERAEKMFRQIEGTTIAVLYNDFADIRLDEKPHLPFTRVDSEDEMINRIEENRGKILFHDYETMCINPEAKGKGRTALDWYYGQGYAHPICTGFTFFQNMHEIGYQEGNHKVNYDVNKVCVLTVPLGERVARAMQQCKIMAFNANYDTGVTLTNTGVRHDIYADPMDAAYVVNQGRKRYNLESLSYEYVPELVSYAGEIKHGGKKTKGESYATMKRPDLWKYCAGDCVISMVLFWKCLEKIQMADQEFLFWTIMCGTRTILRDMEARGVRLNQDVLPQVQEEFSIKLVQTLDDLSTQPEVLWLRSQGITWNPNSNPQILRIYNDYLDAGLEGTGKEVLKTYMEKQDTEHEFTKLLLDYRNYSKLNSTFVVALNKRQEHGIVYASFKTNTTDTGRSSSGGSDTVGLGKTNQINIQNIPRGSSMRRLYRARPGHYLAYADYSQIEVRVAGAYARSEEIYNVCVSDADFHGMMAAMAFKMNYEQVMEEDAAMSAAAKLGQTIGDGTSTRTRSKAITFGLLYGMTPEGLAKRLKLYTPEGELDIPAAERYIIMYFAGMPSVKTFIDDTHAFLTGNYHVRTVFGRMRYFQWLNAAAYRKSVNTLVQATASDIFMLSLQATAATLKKRKFVIEMRPEIGNDGAKVFVKSPGGVDLGVITRRAMPLYGNAVHPWAEVHDAVTWETHNRVPKEDMHGIMEEAMVHGVRSMFPRVDEFMGKIPLHIDFKAVNVWV